LPAQVRAILERLPPEQIAGIELAEFEASGDASRDEAAVAIILDVVAPLLGRADNRVETGA